MHANYADVAAPIAVININFILFLAGMSKEEIEELKEGAKGWYYSQLLPIRTLKGPAKTVRIPQSPDWPE